MPLELIVGAAVGAAAANTTIRQAVRRGMILGLGGLLVAYDRAAAMAHEVAQGARKGVAAAAGSAAEGTPVGPSAAHVNPPPAAAAEPPAATPDAAVAPTA